MGGSVFQGFLMKIMKATSKKKRLGREQKEFIFFICLIALPLAQFCIFYIGVNLNSILLTFRNYDYDTGYSFAGLSNIVRVVKNLFMDATLKYAVRNSLITYAITLLIGTTLALIFSYFIYKKMPLANLYRVTLFLPSVLSSIVMVLLFKYFCEQAVPVVWKELTGKEIGGLLSNSNTAMPTLLFYLVWTGFGTQVLMYTGAMNNISESIVESARLDGATPLREFVSITLPMIWSTFVTFIVVGIAGIFTNQLNLYSFYGTAADNSLYTIGYYLYRATQKGTLPEYSYLSAMGLIFTLIAMPLTFAVKCLLERFGPTTE